MPIQLSENILNSWYKHNECHVLLNVSYFEIFAQIRIIGLLARTSS